ncbi:MAG: S8 family serine peptidase [Bacteroidota bacterium]
MNNTIGVYLLLISLQFSGNCFCQDVHPAPALIDNEFIVSLIPDSKGNGPSILRMLPTDLVSSRVIFPNTYLLKIASEANTDSLVEALMGRSELESIHPNYQISLRSDPLFSSQWQYLNDGQNGGKIDADIDLPEAWNLSTGGLSARGDSLVIAVLDFGFNLGHEDWQKNVWTNYSEQGDNGIDDDQNGYVDDQHGWNFQLASPDVSRNGIGHWHGTPVCGIIGADGGNGRGLSGVNWHIKVMPIVIREDVASIIEAYGYVRRMRKLYDQSDGKFGAYIVATNASFGIEHLQAEDAPIWCNIYDSLGAVGILNVASVPNYAVNIDEEGDMPSSCRSDYLITVTNTNRHDQLDSQAGYGRQTVDLSAPGSGSFTLLNNGGYGLFGGTSAAAPHVAGTVGLLHALALPDFDNHWDSVPHEAALVIRQAIIEGIDPLDDLRSRTVSEGRLNVFNSMKRLYALYRADCPTNSSLSSQVSLFPIPAQSHVYVSLGLDRPSKIQLDIFSMDGRRMLRQSTPILAEGNHRIRLDLEKNRMCKGHYVLRLLSEEVVWVGRMIVND